ncbi:MAG: SRPBCC domain-containing protein [Pseudomonadota bacterium]
MKTRGFAHRIDIAVTPAKVWAVLCGPTLLPLWAGMGARIKPQKGGHWSVLPAPGLEREAMIDIFDPPRRLRLIYLTPPNLPAFDGAVVEDILLDTEGTDTVVRLLCSGVPDFAQWTPHFGKIRINTERSLARLKVLCEQRERMAQASSKSTT